VVFGTVLSGRLQGVQGADRALGMFINTLPLRVAVGARPLAELVRDTHAGLAELLVHEQASLALAQRCSAVAAPLPLFTSLLNYRHSAARNDAIDTADPAWAGVRYLAREERTNYPLTVSVDDFGADFAVTTHAVQGIDPARVNAYLATALAGLATALEDQPALAANTLAVLPAAERTQVLEDFNRTGIDYPRDGLIHQMFERAAAARPDAPALVCADETLSFGQLNRRANALAHRLIALGVKPDDRVALCAGRGAGMIAGILGILKAGAGYVPLDPALPSARLGYLLADSAPAAVLAEPGLTGVLPPCGLPFVLLDGSDGRDDNPDPDALGLGAHHLAYVIYTSGSTGQPKGVMVEHHSALNLWTSLGRTVFDHGRAYYRVGLNAAYSFDGSLQCILQLLSGHCLVMIAQEARTDGEALLRFLEQQRIDILDCAPAQLDLLLRAGLCTRPGYRPKKMLIGGEAIGAASWEQMRSDGATAFFNAYGPTECTVEASIARINGASAQVHIGGPVANTRIYILDAALQPCPIGVPGEIHIGGAGVARGYLNRPELTAERFVPDPFAGVPGARMYKSGDLACWREDGNIVYLGRNDSQVKIRGFRIEPGEIEAALAACDKVAQAAVTMREDQPGEKRLVAYFVAAADAAVDIGALRDALARRLPDYMLPAAFVQLPAFPLTASDKLDRRALPAPDAGALVQRRYAAPLGAAEQAVAAIWQQLLGIPQVGRDDHFFELGGHSLLAMQFVTRLRQQLGVELPLRELFTEPTVRAVATAVHGARQTEAAPIPRADRTRALPLSFAQQRLWFLDRLDPAASTAYHIPAALRLRGALDRDALRAAFGRLVARHESLRTTFVEHAGEPCLKIAAEAGFALAEHDLRHLSGHEQESALDCLAGDEALSAFDLAQGPLVRACLLRLAEQEHVLLVTQHHIVSDGWSTDIMVREVCALYSAFSQGLPDPLAPLELGYADYAAWQRAELAGARVQAQVDYWKRQLNGAPALLELPLDQPRPAVQSYAGASVGFTVPAELTRRLRRLGHAEGATLFMTMLGAWAVLLARLSGQDRVVIGTPVANRGRAELEPLIGLFANTLALQVRLDEDPSVAALLAQLKSDVLEAQTHQDLPFEQVVDALKPPRSLAHSPLFQTMLTLSAASPGDTPAMAGLAVAPLAAGPATSKFDLSLNLTDDGDVLSGALVYASALFEQASIERWRDHLLVLLDAMTAHPEAPVASLALLDAASRDHVLHGLNQTARDYPAGELLHQLFEAQAARMPSATALVFEGETLSYEALNRRANGIAHRLLALGAAPGDRVAICAERGFDMVAGLLGILKAGAAWVPLDPGYPAQRLAYMLDDCAPVALLLDEPLRSALPAALKAGLAMPVLALGAGDDGLPDHNPDLPGLSPQHLAYVIYTSGSTGQPKGAANRHAGVVNRLRWAQDTYRLDAGDKVLQKTPYGFDVSVWEFFLPLMAGAQLVIARPGGHQDPYYLEDTIERAGITTLHFVPSMLQAFLAVAQPARCASLRRVLCSGEALGHALQMRFHQWLPKVELHNLYGPTEAAVDVTAWHCRPDAAMGIVPIGRPIANTRIYVLDRRGQPVPLGVAGEIHIGGTAVGAGYLNRPQQTAERFVDDPFSGVPGARLYRTGDLGRWLADGKLEYLGRNDFQVKIRGLRIEPGEIEAALLDGGDVLEAAVLARQDQPGDQRLVAYLVLRPGAVLDAGALRAALHRTLPDYMVPGAFVDMPAMPVTANGKLDRHALPAPQREAWNAQAHEAPCGERETAVAAIWQDLLGLELVGRNDHFFTLGGHSLLVIAMIERLRQHGLHATVQMVFRAATLADLAAAIDSAAAAPAPFAAPPNLIPDRLAAPLPGADEEEIEL
jgi:amino acid adenylation domain-containing protein